MVKPCFPVSSISCFLCCVFVSSFFLNSLVSLSFPRPDQVEILLAFKNEFPVLKCGFFYLEPKTKHWTRKDVKSFEGVEFDNETGVVTKLDLFGACLSGSLSANSSLFRLHHLRYLDLSFNYFDSSSFLPKLGKLTNLEFLRLSNMGLAGEIPSSISSLNRLTELDLSNNELIGSFFPLLNLSKLSNLDLSSNIFSGNVPCSLLTMPFLSNLDLSDNHLIDSLETMNCSSSSKLEWLDLSKNRLSGRILEPLSKLTNLRELFLSSQNTTDSINFVSSLGFKSLEYLELSGNAISRLDIGSPNLKKLYLANCSINEFPTFIQNLQNLLNLEMGNNRLKGEVPKWVWSLPSLLILRLSYNSLHSFEGSPKMLLNSSLGLLDLSSNAFRGSLPIISTRLYTMLASNNSFTGDIPVSLCNQSYLCVLDLAHNNFSGSIPRCLMFNSSVENMDLRNNNLMERLPDVFDEKGPLRTLDVSQNQITGKLPRSLTNCTYLQYLNVEGNRIADTFPFWLKDLPNLRVMVLRSNMFHGPIYSPQHYPLSFPAMRMVDISRNKFTGRLPHDYFVNWSTLLCTTPQWETGRLYMGDFENEYYPSMYLRNKGIDMELEKILKTYTSIDFSENKLGGQIPDSIGLLKSLIVLNLSSNGFTGHIPSSSWANLTSLESLDLSQNQLTGKIPQELAALSFLERINVSHNKLTGQIPQGTQFGGQPKSSFEGNINLCGLPLEQSCFGDKVPSTPEAQEIEHSKQEKVLNWKAAAMGYGTGVLFGVAIAQFLSSYRLVLFFKLFRL
ncbi:hypothetical protein N665_0147s0082 [Sinapis alba]|nr:hypothetical protein N665_0147s0082 [Sinapis alba]